jgi:sarcosine oxidase subunit gamma
MTITLTQSSALEDVLVLGRFGRSLPEGPGVTLSHVHPCEVASIISASGKSRALAAALKKDFGITLPGMGQSASARGVSMHGVGPGQWLVVSASVKALAGKLDTRLGKIAAVTDQSHGRVMMTMAGPRARDVLSKGTAVDLRPASFKSGMCAATQIGHVGVVIACTGADSFELSVFRSFAEGFWLGLTELALEWGYEVR